MMQSSDALDVAVVGVGRMGRHHARIYCDLKSVNLVAVVDEDEQRAATVAEESGCDFCTSVPQLVAKYPQVRAASVAVPTAVHRAIATPLLQQRIACLIEKPLAKSVSDASALTALAAKHAAVLQVGHTERFNPAIKAIETMGITPRFIEVNRISPMTFRSLDVGVVMDMMIHDLDIVLMLVRSPLDRIDAAGIVVLGDHEDVANARLVFENGCIANLTSSRLALKTERKLRVFSEDSYVSLDYQKGNGLVIQKSDNVNSLEEIRRRLANGTDLSGLEYQDIVQVEELTMDLADGDKDPLTNQLTSFIESVRTGRPPQVDGAAGYAAVDAAQRVVESLHAHQWAGLTKLRV